MGGTRIQEKPKKCSKCDESVKKEFENKLYCWDHYIEAKKISKQEYNKKYARTQLLTKLAIIGVATVGVIAGMIVIYQFITSIQ